MEAIKSAIASTVETVVGDPKQRSLEQYTVADATPGNPLTSNFGVKQSDTDNHLKAGVRGPLLMEDVHFREKMMHFDHERIPERVVHARGSAAHGYFQVYEPLAEITRADFLNNPAKKTPVFVRFSTVMGSRGSADTVRDVRGFATKFYTDEGNFDLVGNNIPVFFIQDSIKFPDIIHAGKPRPDNEIPQAQTAHDNWWDIITFLPESTHMVLWQLSDRTIPRSYRMMQGFGVHTFVLTNAAGKRSFAKFHWIPVLGTHSLVWDEALKINGVDPDFHRRDLYDAIVAGAYPEYELGLQIIPEEDENKFDFDLLDSTKIVPEEMVPVRRVGKLVLDRNPTNFFCETEQVAFCTSHLVPGIEASNDPLLQGRMFSYFDTQLTRLGGPNFQEIPINRPVCPFFNNQRDGFHRQTINRGTVNYFPNRFGAPAPVGAQQGGYVHSPTPVEGVKIRARGPKFAEHFKQAQMFYNSLSDWEKSHVIYAAQFELGKVDDVGVREKMVERFAHVDLKLATDVAVAIGVKPPEKFLGTPSTATSPAVSQAITAHSSIKSRRIAFLVAGGYNAAQLKVVRAGLEAQGAQAFLISSHKGKLEGGAGDEAQFSFFTSKSVMFDAVVLVGGIHYNALRNIGEAVMFVLEAFKHAKPVVALDEGVEFLTQLGFLGIDVSASEQAVSSHGVVTVRKFDPASFAIGEQMNFGKLVFNAIAAHRHFDRDIAKIPA